MGAISRMNMMLSKDATVQESGFTNLLSISMGVDVFTADWLYCDRISSYVARMVSHNRTDSLLYSNLLSSALNELLETAFRCNGGVGSMTCRILRRGARDRIELEIPADDAVLAFFAETAAALARSDAADQYRAALFADGPVDPRMGLLELSVDYGADIEIAPIGSSAVLLAADFNLEPEAAHA